MGRTRIGAEWFCIGSGVGNWSVNGAGRPKKLVVSNTFGLCQYGNRFVHALTKGQRLNLSIQYVTGGLSLVAFVVAALFYAYRASLKQRTDMILAAPPAQRVAAIERTADFLRFDTTALSEKQKERIILEQLKIRARRDQMAFAVALILAVLLAIIALVAMLRDNAPATTVPQIAPAPAPAPTIPPPKVFTHPDVAREGRLLQLKVTIIDNGKNGGSYNIDFYWTGSPGTWSGSQSAIVTLLGTGKAPLQSVTVPIDRSGCFYGGGNHQTKSGELSINPNLVTEIDVTLSEVHNRTEGGC